MREIKRKRIEQELNDVFRKLLKPEVSVLIDAPKGDFKIRIEITVNGYWNHSHYFRADYFESHYRAAISTTISTLIWQYFKDVDKANKTKKLS